MMCPDCGELRHKGDCPNEPTDVTNDRAGALYDHRTSDARVLIWRRIESAPKDRTILLGWFGAHSGVFCIGRGKWGSGLGEKEGWLEYNAHGYAVRLTYADLPKWWAEDVLREPPRDP